MLHFQNIIRRLLGLERIETGLDEMRAEQQRIALELERLKRWDFVGLDVEVEQVRGMHRQQGKQT